MVVCIRQEQSLVKSEVSQVYIKVKENLYCERECGLLRYNKEYLCTIKTLSINIRSL